MLDEGYGIDTKEFIICSAIDAAGVIVCGRRHGDCMNTLELIPSVQHTDKKEWICGFMTSHKRFLDRKEAHTIAVNMGQIIHKIGLDKNIGLTSEDLW